MNTEKAHRLGNDSIDVLLSTAAGRVTRSLYAGGSVTQLYIFLESLARVLFTIVTINPSSNTPACRIFSYFVLAGISISRSSNAIYPQVHQGFGYAVIDYS